MIYKQRFSILTTEQIRKNNLLKRLIWPSSGEMNISVDCEEVVPSPKKRYTCTCHEVEEQILQMARGGWQVAVAGGMPLL